MTDATHSPAPEGKHEPAPYDKRAVLTDISLSVAKGEVLGLLGPNGAGKTTCFYSIMGLVRPDEGRILLDGIDITNLPMYRRAILGLGYLPQETSIFRGLTVEQIKTARMVLWKGHCSVHQMFQAQHIINFRNQYPDGMVISHPECNFEVCKLSDYVGSTDFILKMLKEAKPGTRWLVGTELNLVNRMAELLKPEGKVVQFMAPTVCMWSTMARIDPQHLAWALENLVEGRIVNPIRVPAREAELARTALKRMLEVV